MSNGAITVNNQISRFQPTVFGAVRSHWAMVLVVAILSAAAAVGYSLVAPFSYVAEASITVQLPASSQSQQASQAQYLDSQVLLLQSRALAERAVDVANGTLRGHVLNVENFYGSTSALTIIPPTATNVGSYGASIVSVSFTGRTTATATAGLNAVLQAYDEARSAAIKEQSQAVLAGIDSAISTTNSKLALIEQELAKPKASNADALLTQRQLLQNQLTALLGQQAQATVNEQTDLAGHATVAVQPVSRTAGSAPRTGGIGLVIGVIIGAALAFARTSRRRGIASRHDPEDLYGVPLIAEIPVFGSEKSHRSNGASVGVMLPIATDPDSAEAETLRFAARAIERVCSTLGTKPALAFVSPLSDAGKSTVVANLALAMAEGGARVLAVDADAPYGDLTTQLLPDVGVGDGFEQILAGRRSLADCVRTSPHSRAVGVLGSGVALARTSTGANRTKAARQMLSEAKAWCDFILIDSPAFLQVAAASDLLGAADAAVIVLNPNERIQDHLEMMNRLRFGGYDVIGYIYNRAPMRAELARYRNYGMAEGPGRAGQPSLGDALAPIPSHRMAMATRNVGRHDD